MLLFLPGLICDARTFAPQLAAFPESRAVDGYGTADSLEAMARIALEQAPESFDLFGHSMGGRVALEVFRLAPHRVRRLALASTGVHPLGADEPAKRAALKAIGHEQGYPALVDAWLPPMVAEANRAVPGFYEPIRDMCLGQGQAVFDAQIAALLARPEQESLLPRIACPTLVITGELDAWSPPAQHRDIAAAIPDSTLVTVEGAGHMLPLEAPEALNRAVADWLGPDDRKYLKPYPSTALGEAIKMSEQTLQQKLDSAGNVVDFLRNQQVGPNVYPGVPAEYSNWRNEQRAWAQSAVLFNQSYHMVELYVRGPEAFALLEYTAINSFKNFTVNKAKQYVPVTPEGYVIGDVILFYLAENEFSLVGRAPAIEWVEFHAQYPKPDGSKWNVTVERDERTALRTDGKRKNYRFQLQGPNAMKTLEKAMGQTPPDLKFFNMAHIDIAGKDVIALRHGMAGQPGYELFGPWEDYAAVHAALVEAGKDFGLALVGGRAYSSNTLESGWLPSPLPAFYTGDSQIMRDYRAWASGKSYAGMCSIGGSYVPDSIEGYYLTPWDIGYGHIVKFDHDFIGREALERMANEKHKQKVTLALDPQDVQRVMSSLFAKGDRAKYFEFPSAVYAMHPFDSVKCDGKEIGVSTWIGYSSNEGAMLSLAMIDPDYVEFGKEVTLVWGEPNGGTSKPTVEPHVQTEIKAIVSPVPYSAVARNSYADSWRQTGVGANA